MRIIQVTLFICLVALASLSVGQAAEKMKFATAVKLFPPYYLPALTALEKGMWKENGLEAELITFSTSGPMYRAMATGQVEAGMAIIGSTLQAAAAGVPVVVAADLYTPDDFYIWVRADGPVKKPADLKGRRIAVLGLRSAAHAYGSVAVKALGLEKDVRFVGSGGVSETLAALRAGAVDATVSVLFAMLPLKARGEVRGLVRVHDYLPKEWVDHVTVAHRDLAKKKADVEKRMVKGLLQANDYIREDQAWALDKMKKESRYSDELAKLAYELLARNLSKDGKVPKKAVENVRSVLIDFGILSEAKTPPATELYVGEFKG